MKSDGIPKMKLDFQKMDWDVKFRSSVYNYNTMAARSFFDAKKMKKKIVSLDLGDNPIYPIWK